MRRALYYGCIISVSYALIISRRALIPSSVIFIVHSRRRHLGRAVWKRTLRIALIGIYPVVRRSDAHSPSPLSLSRDGSRENPL